MNKINETIKKTNGSYPEKVLQFGEGNFLRAFVDWMIDEANDGGLFGGSIVICQPIGQGMVKMINDQDGMYTVIMRGLENGEKIERTKVITSVSRAVNPFEDYDSYLALAESEDLKIIVSNTTEAGISYSAGDQLSDKLPKSFPAKICAFLYHRYQFFGGSAEHGILLLPVELIDNNGPELKRIVKQYANEWQLEEGFHTWLDEACSFANTLVDRIVTGYPRDENAHFEERFGYEDKLMVTSELFNLWVIEADKKYSELLPIDKTAANVIWTDDVRPYKKRKVRILNGGHTSTVLGAYLAGFDYVGEFMMSDDIASYLRQLIFEEVIPTIDLPEEELHKFAEDVFDRFRNPYIKHRLLDISLNSVAKFTARCLPSLLDFQDHHRHLPKRLVFSLAALIKFYDVQKDENGYFGTRENGEKYPVKDDEEHLSFFEAVWQEKDMDLLVERVLSEKSLWQQDLSLVPGLKEGVLEELKNIMTGGILASLRVL